MTQTRWNIEVASDLAVVGYNPEAADMDHPRGEQIGEVFYLRAVNDRGDAREIGTWNSFDAAEDAIPDAPPVYQWHPARPAYGSRAWEAYGEEMELECERRERDAELYGFDTRFGAF